MEWGDPDGHKAEKECGGRERKVETGIFGSRPIGMWKKENDRKQPAVGVFVRHRLAAVRLDNSHPDNGAEYSEGSFHCPIVPHVMKNPASSQARCSTRPSREAVLTTPKIESGEHSAINEKKGNNGYFQKWNAIPSGSNKDKYGNHLKVVSRNDDSNNKIYYRSIID